MKRSILSVAAASVVALGAIAAAPRPANAVWWVAPAIAAGVVGGVAVGAAANANANAYAYDYDYGPGYGPPRGAVYAAPTASCYWARVRTPDGALIRQRVCD